MKYLFILVIVWVTMSCFADEQQLTLIGELKLSQASKVLYWSESDAELKSWELSFTMTTASSMSEGDIFRAKNYGTEHRKKFLSLSVEEKVKIYSTTDVPYFESSGNIFKISQTYALTLRYVTTLDALNSPINGKFEMICNDESVSCFVIDEFDKIGIAWLKNDKKQGAMLDTLNGSYKYENIVLTKLDDRIIPEPSTSVIFLFSACGLMLFRRRK